jgi:hypothetical protein
MYWQAGDLKMSLKYDDFLEIHGLNYDGGRISIDVRLSGDLK